MTVPVTIKSLVFSEDPRHPHLHSARIITASRHDHHHDHRHDTITIMTIMHSGPPSITTTNGAPLDARAEHILDSPGKVGGCGQLQGAH